MNSNALQGKAPILARAEIPSSSGWISGAISVMMLRKHSLCLKKPNGALSFLTNFLIVELFKL